MPPPTQGSEDVGRGLWGRVRVRDAITRGQTAELGILTQRPGSRPQSHKPTGNTGLKGCRAESLGVAAMWGQSPDPTGHVEITWTEMQSSQEDEKA